MLFTRARQLGGGVGVDKPEMYTEKGVLHTRANSEELFSPSGCDGRPETKRLEHDQL
jgi:hypothetical protein